MRPPKRSYEKVPVGVEVLGIIEKCEYDEKHAFKGYEGKEGTIQPAIRIVFRLDGCQYLHKSRFMKLSLNAKSTLFKKYASVLIEGLEPEADIDLDILAGTAVSTRWSDNGDFQNLDEIKAIGPKIKQDAAVPEIDVNGPPADPQEEEPPSEEPNF